MREIVVQCSAMHLEHFTNPRQVQYCPKDWLLYGVAKAQSRMQTARECAEVGGNKRTKGGCKSSTL